MEEIESPTSYDEDDASLDSESKKLDESSNTEGLNQGLFTVDKHRGHNRHML